jgi:hypothetical protein
MAIDPANDAQSIYGAGKELLSRFSLQGKRVRLVGVGVKDLMNGAPPPTLFTQQTVVKKSALEKVQLAIAQRFGRDHITHADLMDDEETQVVVPDKERV